METKAGKLWYCVRVLPPIKGKMQKIISSLGISQTGKAGAEILRLQLQGCRLHYLRKNVSLPWSEMFPSLPKEGREKKEKLEQTWPEQVRGMKGAFAACRRLAEAAQEHHQHPGSSVPARATVTLAHTRHILKMLGGKGWRTLNSLTSPRL